MKKRIIILDDDADDVWLEELKHDIEDAVNENSPVSYDVIIDYYNPTDTLGGPEPLDKALEELSDKIGHDKTDLFLCDFNVNENHKLVSFHFIEMARKLNSNCTILLYSGNPLKELLRLEHEDLAEKIQEYIAANGDTALEGLSKFIRGKNPYEFQDIVAALLRVIGYYTPFISPRGKDGGLDR